MALSRTAQSSDRISQCLVVVAVGALTFGLWRLAAPSELPALYWLVAGGLCLKAGNDRERTLAAR
jgi:hypothetical protein